MSNKAYLGIDVGSVSCNVVAIDENGKLIFKKYIRTQGQPIEAVKCGLFEASGILSKYEIAGVGTTGSGRILAGFLVGADVIKNEITTHAAAAQHEAPNVRTVIEIGGQDSKIILLDDGVVTDFAMNTVCAAGTGSFLDQQCSRLGIEIENFGDLALQSSNSVSISGRCTVFAESDMIHKQQIGAKREDIIRGLCEALVRNYLNNVGKGKEIVEPIIFQGGVAANKGIKAEFEKALGKKVTIPDNFDVMGAIGAALLAKEAKLEKTKFKGFDISKHTFETTAFNCPDCSNNCEVIEFKENGKITARWGDRCGKWEENLNKRPEIN
ncbi:MAG: acyl-CoA dehydratase activase [Candidatus Buchananbacteria bacterium]